MKARIDQKLLADATRWAARQLPVKPAHPVHSALRLVAADSRLVVEGYDGAVASTCHILDAEVMAEGSTIVPGLLLSQITGQLPAGDLELTLEDAGLTIAGDSASYLVGTLDEHDYPRLPSAPDASGTVASDLLASAVARVAAMADADGTAGPAFAGVRVRAHGSELTFTATDRFRVAFQTVPWEPDGPGHDASALIPVRALQEAARSLARAGDVRLSLPADGMRVALAGQGMTVALRVIANEFPPVDAAMATVAAQACLTADAEELAKAVRRVQLVAAEKSPIRLAAGVDHLVLSAFDGVNGRGREVLEAQLEGPEELALHMKPGYLLDALAPLSGAAVFDVAHPAKAFIVRGEDVAGYRCLLMPQRDLRTAA